MTDTKLQQTKDAILDGIMSIIKHGTNTLAASEVNAKMINALTHAYKTINYIHFLPTGVEIDDKKT